MAMENGPGLKMYFHVFPIEYGDIPLLLLVYQRVAKMLRQNVDFPMPPRVRVSLVKLP